ncbi:thiol reductase thioredoxin [Neisseria dentiae]|uniref:Thiol reductase thioredoxin n=1 Tax=Neisseria dentiae TaxID=194197 RepID=A0A1X3D3E7_9NEIS|nr:thioredoxin family protein [Neisseria dentiae]OSI14231.1 thiol reductase thioredoxin [Neisseria dentiae]QMT44703.1 thioredoxin family protein [Neisseria dentiae]STZ50417.1 putative bacteriocin transport accessory protein [Neisseria dentiae]
MSAKILISAALVCLLAACGSPHRETQALQNKLAEAETAVRLSAENSKRLESTYSDIYFELNSLTVENFKAKVAGGDTFYAYIGRPSCGDCNAFEPMFKRYIASHKLGGKIYFVNVHRLHQDKPAWAAFKQQYGLSGTPVLAKYAKGRQINKLDFEDNKGISAEDLEKWLALNKL